MPQNNNKSMSCNYTTYVALQINYFDFSSGNISQLKWLASPEQADVV
jgi:hypothetical protein